MSPLIPNPSLVNFCIYGIGSTGMSVINYFEKNNFKEYRVWDDDEVLRRFHGLNIKKKTGEKLFSQHLDSAEFIVVSPGISLKKAKLKKKLIENKHKIITDIDLFYLLNPKIKTIVVTGTNGKSTTCKILEHMLKKNKINVRLGGNIGKPVLDLDLKSKPLVIIEASSFQLAYSQFIRPDYAAILNITNDHLDWHGSTKEYIDSKFKIFSNQKNNNFALLNNKALVRKFKKNKYESKLKFINKKKYNNIKNKIKNYYLSSEANSENMSYVYAFSKILKIKEKFFVKSLKSFKGLAHRHEIFYKKNNKIFINDSKATSFESSRFALKSNKNIFWIVGGLPKLGDKFQLEEVRKNIMKAYIVGKHVKHFKRFFKDKISFELSMTLNNAINSIFRDIKSVKGKKITILLSPASASYDQFKNFEDRGDRFKKLTIHYAKRYF